MNNMKKELTKGVECGASFFSPSASLLSSASSMPKYNKHYV